MKTETLSDTSKPIPARPRNVNAARAAGDTQSKQAISPVAPPTRELGDRDREIGAGSPAPQLPTPNSQLPPVAERTLADILEFLCRPFHLQHIELKPGATTGDKSRALALPYVDSRIYQKRLDYLAGVDGWRAQFESWGATRLICRLTILGVTKEATGEGDASDPNCGTIAEAQAFKRACSAFGCGRYLYDLPQRWFDYDAQKKRFADPAGAAREIYRLGGLVE